MEKFALTTVMARTHQLQRPWALVEYSAMLSLDAPPVLLYVVATKMSDVIAMTRCNANSEWRRLIGPDTPVHINIVGAGTRLECEIEASRLIQHHGRAGRFPRCNAQGAIGGQTGKSSPIGCSNGQTYASQLEAAETLGLNQSAISQVINGRLKRTGGLVFWRVVQGAPAHVSDPDE